MATISHAVSQIWLWEANLSAEKHHRRQGIERVLTHWGRDKIDAI